MMLEVYESDEMLVVVFGSRNRNDGHCDRDVKVIVRRPIPIESVPCYLFGTEDRENFSGGMLMPERCRRQDAELYDWGGELPPCEWVSPVTRN